MCWLWDWARADAGVGADVSAKRTVWCVADSLADLCAGGRAGRVEFAFSVARAVRILSAVRDRGSCGLALNTRGLWRGCLAADFVGCARVWYFCA